MKSLIVRPHELSQEDVIHWRALVNADPALDTPFLQPEFALSVGKHRRDARVAILQREGITTGFFAFQMRARGVGEAIGYRLSDAQAVIAPADMVCDPAEVVCSCGLYAWHFDHLVTTTKFAPYRWIIKQSHRILLEGGAKTYLEALLRAGSETIRQTERKARKLQRHWGEVQFTWEDACPAALEQLFAWKRRQQMANGARTTMEYPWIIGTLRELHASTCAHCRGILSTLRVDGRLIAAHLGLASRRVMHWWIAAYEPDFAKYSPGMILMYHAIEAAGGNGMLRIELGPGEYRYKRSFGSAGDAVAEGAVVPSSARRAAVRAWYAGRVWARQGRAAGTIRALKTTWRRMHRAVWQRS